MDIKYSKENLGKRDPQYGGVLTELSTLAAGTTFFVCNGGWEGEIALLENGVKAVKAYCAGISGQNRKPVNVTPLSDSDNILALSNIKVPDK